MKTFLDADPQMNKGTNIIANEIHTNILENSIITLGHDIYFGQSLSIRTATDIPLIINQNYTFEEQDVIASDLSGKDCFRKIKFISAYDEVKINYHAYGDFIKSNNINDMVEEINDIKRDLNDGETGLISKVETNASNIESINETLHTEDSGLVDKVETIEGILDGDDNPGLISKIETNINDIESINNILNGDEEPGLIAKVETNASNIESINETLHTEDSGLVDKFNTEIVDRQNADIKLSSRIDRVEGMGGALTAHNFDTLEPTMEELLAYAVVEIWGEGGTFLYNQQSPKESTYEVTDDIHEAREIFNNTWVRNTYQDKNHKWILTNTPNTRPEIFSWANVGQDIVENANDELAGVSKLYNTVGTNTDGGMTQAAISSHIDTKFDKSHNVADAGKSVIVGQNGDLILGAAGLLDNNAATDTVIGDRALTDESADSVIIPVTAKKLLPWLQGIRNNIKWAFNNLLTKAAADTWVDVPYTKGDDFTLSINSVIVKYNAALNIMRIHFNGAIANTLVIGGIVIQITTLPKVISTTQRCIIGIDLQNSNITTGRTSAGVDVNTNGTVCIYPYVTTQASGGYPSYNGCRLYGDGWFYLE
jgi:hypothetical protein